MTVPFHSALAIGDLLRRYCEQSSCGKEPAQASAPSRIGPVTALDPESMMLTLRRRLLGPALLAGLLAPAALRAAISDRGEEIFRKALAYTVQIKSSVSMPFAGDAKGSMLGAGFVIDAER